MGTNGVGTSGVGHKWGGHIWSGHIWSGHIWGMGTNGVGHKWGWAQVSDRHKIYQRTNNDYWSRHDLLRKSFDTFGLPRQKIRNDIHCVRAFLPSRRMKIF